MKKIKLLSKNLINQIAAGEVIERPASIVKELVENSIDAGSTKIEVEISNECRDIRVSDNGSGIKEEDIELAFSKHATSKITHERDLWDINTLGFRGEALASIISIAKLTCTTRTANSEDGIKAFCEDSEIKISKTGCAVGTTMEIKDLFFNIPVRKKFLKNQQTEFSYILEILQSIAIANSKVSINLIYKGKNSLKTTGSGDIATVISEVYSKDLILELKEVFKEDLSDNLKINGFVSSPDFTRSSKKAIYLFINGRTVKCPILLKSVDLAYKYLIPSGKYPFVVLNLQIPAKEVDVNVHPTKKEVRYTNPNQIFNFVRYAIKSALEYSKPAQSFYPIEQEEEEYTKTPVKSAFHPTTTQFRAKTDFNKLKEQFSKSVDFYAPKEETTIKQGKFDVKVEQKEPKEFINIIGQYKNTYIIFESPNGLEIVDQHIAHERTIFEHLKNTQNIVSQLLLTSDVINLEPSQLAILQETQFLLEKYGFKIKTISEKEVILRQIPQILVNKEPEKVIYEILENIESIEDIENKILISASCRGAVMAGDKLSVWQMEEIIRNWRKSPNNKTCPHGRIISHTISLKEVASFFGRANTSSKKDLSFRT
ncbi:MAG: DNA mismatch repair endonuclease MutL [Candidatus Gastranaerophilales bacterium]|nr:DNA mismatch repair endonuclease MutL [Candidatus Gastranaerophilales bacterium]